MSRCMRISTHQSCARESEALTTDQTSVILSKLKPDLLGTNHMHDSLTCVIHAPVGELHTTQLQ